MFLPSLVMLTSRCNQPEDAQELLSLWPARVRDDQLGRKAVVPRVVRLAGGDGSRVVLQVAATPRAGHDDVRRRAAQLAGHRLGQRRLALLREQRAWREARIVVAILQALKF